MREPIEVEYFDWLCAKVLAFRTTHQALMQILYETEFVWFVKGDKNRAEDGLELRQHFLNETDWERDPAWFYEPCSLFEFFIAFAQRASFQTDIPVVDWFWRFMENLNLDEYRQVSNSDIPQINIILDTFVQRQYDPNGYGGLFPLCSPKNDQRKVECWYQFHEYIEDQGLF